MNEYYHLIARAVLKLEKDTVNNRQELYDRARGALATLLDRHVPPIPKHEIAAERRALEAAIRKIAAELAPAICIEGALAQNNSLGAQSLQILQIDVDALRITRNSESTKVVPAGLANSELHRQRALMLRAIGTSRCIDLAAHHDQLALAIEQKNATSPPRQRGLEVRR